MRLLSQDLIKRHGRVRGNMYRSYIPSVKYDQPLLSPRLFWFFFNTGHDFLNALKLPGNNNLVQLLIILVIISAFVEIKKCARR